MAIYDVTIPMRDALACWPGDAPFRFTWSWRMAEGASVNVGQVSLSVHTGTHIDAPYHFDGSGPTAEALPLTPYLGPARVVHLPGRSRITRADLERFDLGEAPRLLIRTDAWSDHARFPESIPTLDEDVPAWLGARGVVLVGLDVPSVDDLESKSLPNHHALGRAGVAILESLDLSAVSPGLYQLIALPLKLVGADGSPVRAILRDGR